MSSISRSFLAKINLTGLKLSVAAVVLIFTCIVYGVSYNIHLHPLARFPGPKRWTATRLSYVYSLWFGTLSKDVRQLHLQYGYVVRIAPNEKSFARPDAMNDIYMNMPGRPAIPKSKVWHSPQPGRPLSVLNALEAKNHQRYRKAMEPGFTDKAVRGQEPINQAYADSLISHLDELVSEASDGVVVDIVRWYAFTVFDLIGDLGFGESFDCLQSNKLHPWVSLIFNSLRAATLNASLRYYPRVHWLASFAIPKSVKRKGAEHWHGITNYLIKNPDKLIRLRNEIRGLCLEEKEISLSALQDVLYFNATIQEGLRLCNPVPIGLPRITPAGGATISGFFVPENTFVNMHPLTISLSPEHFHEPLKFCPERWLSTSTEDTTSPFFKDNREAVQTFGVGPRSCIGRRIALAELRLILSRLIWKFDLEEVDTPSGKLEWMSQRDFMVVERLPFEIKLKAKGV
ncbi:Versicolorin B desaturase [Lachnellula occidentalis]|uniref:Versicolorin B desaturase n=1 Tax=Lachnellula occidentalis TaxID=215460 RepID=A0A8H8S968_9HELO|nr:Versicolorin B desaturase [Lachnellula occidentalis]